MKQGEIPVEPFRERYVQLTERGETPGEIARRMGYVRNDGSADSTRLRRDLGLQQWRSRGRNWTQRAVSPQKAERLCVGLDLDPVDVGL